MKFYILSPEPSKQVNANDYEIIKVKPVDETEFLAVYGHRVIASGSNLMEAILNFEASKNE